VTRITLEQAKQDPVAWLTRVVRDREHILVEVDGQPVAELRPVASLSTTSERPDGLAKGLFVVPDDFDAPLPEEILRDFEGS
jgi:antitoxin (DNA-binding transcriptional repressor) of toxin-antitoxin stability system